jgi:hypothetical protein
MTERKKDRETERQKERKAKRHKDRKKERQKRHKDRKTERHLLPKSFGFAFSGPCCVCPLLLFMLLF